jgi:transcription termination factor NusB
MGSRRKARECALQMLFAADIAEANPAEVLCTYWAELGEADAEDATREFATR